MFDWFQIRRHTWPLNHFHPVLLQKSNSGLKCVFRIIVMLKKWTTTKGRSDGSIFSFSIEQYICKFMMPSMKCSSPTPATLMQPHIRTLPCFTVGTMHFSLYSSPLRRHTVLKPSVPKTFILVSSLQIIESQ